MLISSFGPTSEELKEFENDPMLALLPCHETSGLGRLPISSLSEEEEIRANAESDPLATKPTETVTDLYDPDADIPPMNADGQQIQSSWVENDIKEQLDLKTPEEVEALNEQYEKVVKEIEAELGTGVTVEEKATVREQYLNQFPHNKVLLSCASCGIRRYVIDANEKFTFQPQRELAALLVNEGYGKFNAMGPRKNIASF